MNENVECAFGAWTVIFSNLKTNLQFNLLENTNADNKPIYQRTTSHESKFKKGIGHSLPKYISSYCEE
jgi:hypothetical protein